MYWTINIQIIWRQRPPLYQGYMADVLDNKYTNHLTSAPTIIPGIHGWCTRTINIQIIWPQRPPLYQGYMADVLDNKYTNHLTSAPTIIPGIHGWCTRTINIQIIWPQRPPLYQGYMADVLDNKYTNHLTSAPTPSVTSTKDIYNNVCSWQIINKTMIHCLYMTNNKQDNGTLFVHDK